MVFFSDKHIWWVTILTCSLHNETQNTEVVMLWCSVTGSVVPASYKKNHCTFIIMITCSLRSWPWRWRHCSPLKWQKPPTQQHSITSQRTWIFSSAAVRTLNFVILGQYTVAAYLLPGFLFDFPSLNNIFKNRRSTISLWGLPCQCEGSVRHTRYIKWSTWWWRFVWKHSIHYLFIFLWNCSSYACVQEHCVSVIWSF